MTTLIDANTLSFTMAGESSARGRLLSQARTEALLPQPVVAEVEYDMARMKRSKGRTGLVRRFQALLRNTPRAVRTDEASHACGRTRAELECRGMRLEDFDVCMAAHALTLDGTPASDNMSRVRRIRGLRMANWRPGPTESPTST